MSITASEARRELFRLIKQVDDDHDVVEVVSEHGNAVLMSAEDCTALRKGSYLLNARRLLKAYGTPGRPGWGGNDLGPAHPMVDRPEVLSGVVSAPGCGCGARGRRRPRPWPACPGPRR
ncbi:prevent-host-death family protein [Saccharothrix yanglingensis]|uniref:Prevent-host-death family protein n=1 Tax=Saccharothrix yanglingensis TaxID=659496 RepID=A0ABU0WXZ6_9PSEU|nr:prevent-host-death family protein [Saccharothrix yanglingensis]